MPYPYCPQYCYITEEAVARFRRVAQIDVDDSVNPYAVGWQTQPDRMYSEDDAPENPGFFCALKICYVEKYFSLQGRGSRSEFWFFFFVVLAVEFLIDLPIARDASALFSDALLSEDEEAPLGVVVCHVFLFCPLLGATIRRYHDVGLSAWSFFSIYLAYAGLIGAVFYVMSSTIDDLNVMGLALGGLVVLTSVNGGTLSVQLLLSSLNWLALHDYEVFVVLLSVLIVVAFLINFSLLFRSGTKGPNKYGPAPQKRPRKSLQTQ